MKKSTISEIQEKLLPWIVFRIEEGYYAISTRFVSAIALLDEECTPIPESKAYVRGLVTFRGEPIQVIDMRLLFGREALQESNDRSTNELILALQDKEKTVAIVVDGVVGVQDIELLKDSNVKNIIEAGFSMGVAKTATLDVPVLLLDDNIFLNLNEL